MSTICTIPAYIGKNQLNGNHEYRQIEILESMVGTWQIVESIERVGIDICINFGHKSSTMVWIDKTLGMIGRESAKVLIGMNLDQAMQYTRRKQALTTISGQLCNSRCKWSKIRFEACMVKWDFTLAHIREYAASVHKLAALNARLDTFGM